MLKIKQAYREKEHFNAIASNFDNMFGYSAKKRLRKINWIVENSKITNAKNVLELGCSTGKSTEMFAKTCGIIHAVDISFNLLQIAKRKRQYKNICYAAADVEKLPFNASCFDAIIGTFILHHLNLNQVLPEISRVCKPGARISFCEPNMMNPIVFLIKNISCIKNKIGESKDETAFLRWNLARVIGKYGFTDISIIPIEFLAPGIPNAIAPIISCMGRHFEKIPLIREFGGSLLIKARRL